MKDIKLEEQRGLEENIGVFRFSSFNKIKNKC